MISITKYLINPTISGKNSSIASVKLFNSNILNYNKNKLKHNSINRNLCTLPVLKSDYSVNIKNKNFVTSNNTTITLSDVFSTNYYNSNHSLKNWNGAFSTSCNNLLFSEIDKKNDNNCPFKKLSKNIKPTINNVIRNLSSKIVFSTATIEPMPSTAMKWSGNVDNGFILLDEDEINIQQLSNLFHGFFIYNKNKKSNRNRTYYDYNYRNDPWNARNHRHKNSKKGGRKRKRQLFKNFNLNNKNVFYTLLGLNLLVFAAWQYAIEQAQVYNNYKYYRFMEDNFCVSWEKVVTKKHWWTILTSAFSHQEKMHFIVNMLVFNSFAEPVMRAIGPENFLALYLFSGACSSLSHITYNHFLLPKMHNKTTEESFFDFFFPQQQKAIYDSISSLGASGAIMGVNTLFACLYPHSIIQYGMFLPLPAWLGMSLYTLMDIYRTATMTNGRIDTAGHVGGALSGLMFYFIKIRPYIQRWKKFY